MGNVLMAIDWNWPVEWEDGTGAHLTDQCRLDHEEKGPLSAYFIDTRRDPRGWTRLMPKTGGAAIMVTPAGELDGNFGPLAPKLRNVTMPALRWLDGEAPVGGTIENDGRTLYLFRDSSEDKSGGVYAWPTLRSLANSAPIREVTIAQIQAEQAAATEQAEMEENPMFGMF